MRECLLHRRHEAGNAAAIGEMEFFCDTCQDFTPQHRQETELIIAAKKDGFALLSSPVHRMVPGVGILYS
jgi:hypothetical protein